MQSQGNGPPRIGVYICHCGGNISDVVDVAQVTEAAAQMPGVEVARHYVFMCSDPGQNLIAEDIRDKGLDAVVVAACSPSLHELTFRRTLRRAGLNPYVFEPANIREQVSWCHAHDPQGATAKAIRLVAAAVAKTRLLQPLDAIRVETTRRAAVIGGGVAGLRAALDLARRAIDVTLIEKSPFLGGRMAQLHTLYPTDEEARPLIAELATDVQAEPRISIHTYAEVTGIGGYIGQFRIGVRQLPRGVTAELERLDEALAACPEETASEFDCNLTKRKAIYRPYEGCFPSLPAIDWETCTRCGRCQEALGGKGILLDQEPVEFELSAGAIVIATGFDHYEPRVGEFGYGQYSPVITLPQLIRILDPDGPTGGRLSWAGRDIRSVALIHCVGSRELEGFHEPREDGRVNDYCSRVCCTATLQAANEISERWPDVDVFELYQDIRAYGKGHEDYYEQASKRGVLFFRYAADEPPTVEAAEGREVPILVRVKDLLTYNEELELPVDLVVLSVGVMPRDIRGLVDAAKLPVGTDRFLLEVHPKLRPVESAIDGIVLAGSAQGPMDTTEACAAASAAAAKAAVILSGEHVELPPFVAEVDLARCDGCGLCVEECEYTGAIALLEMDVNEERANRAQVNPAICKGCGACGAVCPHRAIDVKGWTLPQFEAMVDALAADTSVTAGEQ
jgi:heterodisulfide reductase subunit A